MYQDLIRIYKFWPCLLNILCNHFHMYMVTVYSLLYQFQGCYILQLCTITYVHSSSLISSTLFNSLGDNEVGDAGATALADALRVNQTLKVLKLVTVSFIIDWAEVSCGNCILACVDIFKYEIPQSGTTYVCVLQMREFCLYSCAAKNQFISVHLFTYIRNAWKLSLVSSKIWELCN